MTDCRTVLSGPLSAVSGLSLVINGRWSEREARNLIRVLQLQIEALRQPDHAAVAG